MATLNSFIHRLKTLKIQGAKQIAVQSLLFLKSYDPKFGRKFDSAAKQIEHARPTAVVLHNCLNILKRERSSKAFNEIISELQNATKNIAEHGVKLVKTNDVIMTYCHSGEALSIVKACKRIGKHVSVIATITEPAHQGIRTTEELRNSGIPVTLIEDSALGVFIPHADVVIVGSDAMRKEGNVNKIGSYLLALAANAHGKPYYVAGSTFKIDKRKTFAIEERPATEVWHKMKHVTIRNPAFDVTPWKYVTGIITENGLRKPRDTIE